MYKSKNLIGEGFKFYFTHYKVTILLISLQVLIYFLINYVMKIFWVQSNPIGMYFAFFLTIFIWVLISTFYKIFVLNYIKLIETTDRVSVVEAAKNTFKYHFLSNLLAVGVVSLFIFASSTSENRKKKNQKLGPPTAGAFRTDVASSGIGESLVKLSAYWLFQLSICYTVLNRVPMHKSEKNIKNLVSQNLVRVVSSLMRIGFYTSIIILPFIGLLYIGLDNYEFADPIVFVTLPGLIASIYLYTGSIEVIHAMMIVMWNEKWKVIAKKAIHNNERIPDFDQAELPSLFNKKPDLPLEGFID